MRWKRLDVTEGEHSQIVFYPDSGDKIETKDLQQFAEEKTKDDLRKLPPKEKPKYSKKEVGQALRELRLFKLRQKEGVRRYY